MSPASAAATGAARVELDVNGTVADVRASLSTTLLTVLRDDLHLTAAKRGCNQGVCGACTVEIDGVPMRACLSLAHGCVDRPVRTLEGMLETPRMQALQRAFTASGAFQCGFCTPGVLVAAHALLASDPDPDEAEIRRALSGNLCRCTGYARIVAAVRSAASTLAAAASEAAA
jgi:aerobic-type carbon monoxide dehydrogenase small subunit (CoxS/CutS family)